MIRFALVALTAAIAFASALFLSTAHAQDSSPPPITGEWTGKYICTQGITALNLRIANAGGNAIKATFNFGPLRMNVLSVDGNRPAAWYIVSVQYVQER